MSNLVNRVIGPSSAKRSLKKAFNKKRPVFLWGPPGIGKSDIVGQLGDEIGAHVIDVRLSLWDPTDIKGIPYFDAENNNMRWAPPVELPSEELASAHKNIILFLDEMNSAPPAVQAAAYQLILNRRVGQYQLPNNVIIVAAGNRETDRGVTYRMPAPLSNRFIHLEMSVDWDDWFQWATENRIHNDVIGFLTVNKKDLYDFDPKGSSRAFATPRSWTFVSELLDDNDVDEAVISNLTSGSVGEGLAIKFMAYRTITSKLPDPRDILSGRIKKLDKKEISAMYSLTINLCYELKDAHDKNLDTWNDQVNNFFRFMMDNFEVELVILGARVALKTYNLPLDPDEINCFDEFHTRYGKYVSQAIAR